jgi:hypothetical protein
MTLPLFFFSSLHESLEARNTEHPKSPSIEIELGPQRRSIRQGVDRRQGYLREDEPGEGGGRVREKAGNTMSGKSRPPPGRTCCVGSRPSRLRRERNRTPHLRVLL